MSGSGTSTAVAGTNARAGGYSRGIKRGHAAIKHGELVAPVRGAEYGGPARSMADQYAASIQGRELTPVANGYQGVVEGSQNMQNGKKYNPGQKFMQGGNAHINVAPVNMGNLFKTGMGTVQPTPNPTGMKNPMPKSDDAGAKGLGTATTNELQTRQVFPEPTAYARAYHDESQMKSLLPEGGFVMQFCPDDDMERTTSVFHNISTINSWMRDTGSGRDNSFKHGEIFARQWRFAGVPLSVERHQGGLSTSNVVMSLCVRGQRNVKNVFAASGKVAQCGTRLYLLLRKILTPDDIQADAQWVDSHAQSHNPYYDYIAEFATKHTIKTAPKDSDGRAYWQLVPYMTLSDQPPAEWLWNGPDWEGTYWQVGTVEQTDSEKEFPRQDEANVIRTVHPNPAQNEVWQENFAHLNTISINVGGMA
jgi:hypothetical protein